MRNPGNRSKPGESRIKKNALVVISKQGRSRQSGLTLGKKSLFLVYCLCPTHFPHAGSPHPIPINIYSKKITTITIIIINLVFFHHIRLRNPRLRILKSCALPPSRSVLSTSKSMRSPRSRTRSVFSVMMSRTLSISRLAEASESAGGAVLYVCRRERSSPLKAAQP